MKLGVCYYPEHWERSGWKTDLAKMREIGIEWVRIGEFSWSILEPEEGKFNFTWLDEVLALMEEYRLKVVLGTPTATPPIWMVQKHSDMLAVDSDGRLRKFGSRRHYCFSHLGYRDEAKKICEVLSERYGRHPAIGAWQTDNEYGCHDTVLSYSQSARAGFQKWLENKYHHIAELNRAWGNVFWSMTYHHFNEIDVPHLTVTEGNPAWRLDFWRYSSDQVAAFNRCQVMAIKKYSPLPILHNYMGQFTDFDHFEVADDLDLASWDSYPLGFLSLQSDTETKIAYLEQGDPDFQALNHEIYYRVGQGRFWVMEQQPGPVNWAPYNSIPKAGMVRLWTWEAFFHGAEVVSYFRWRQAPWGQEQMHAGLLKSDGRPSRVIDEVTQTHEEIEKLKALISQPTNGGAGGNLKATGRKDTRDMKGKVGVVLDYESFWAWKIQPLTEDFSHFEYLLLIFRAARKLGLTIEIISSRQTEWNDYSVVIVPLLFTFNEAVIKAIQENEEKPISERATVVFGPCTGGKTAHFSNRYDYPDFDWFPVTVDEVATYPKSYRVACEPCSPDGIGNEIGNVELYYEKVSLKNDRTKAIWQTKAIPPSPVLLKADSHYYLAGCGDEKLWTHLFRIFIDEKKAIPLIATDTHLLRGLRVITHKHHSRLLLFMNYGDPQDISPFLTEDMKIILGHRIVGTGELTIVEIEK